MPWINGTWYPDYSGSFLDPVTGLRTPASALAGQASQVGNLPASQYTGSLSWALPSNLQGPQAITATVPRVLDTTGTLASDVANAIGGATGTTGTAARSAIGGLGGQGAAGTAGMTAEELALNLGAPAALLAAGRGGGGKPPVTGGAAAAGGAEEAAGAAGAAETATQAASKLGLVRSLANPYTIGGTAATFGINAALPKTGTAGNIRQVLADAATGAAMGAPIGFMGGPLDFISVPVAVGGGALIGAAKGIGDILWGEPEKPQLSTDQRRAALTANAQKLGLANPDQYGNLFDTYKGLTDNTGKPVTDDIAAEKVNNLIISDWQTAQATAKNNAQMAAQTQANAQAIMAIQSQANDYFQPYANNLIASGFAEADALRGLAKTLPPQYASLFNNQADQVIAQQNRLGSAYMLQATLAPSLQLAQMSQDQQQQYLDQQTRLAQLQAAYQKAQGTSGGSNLLNPNSVLNPNNTLSSSSTGGTAGTSGYGQTP